MSSNTKNTTHWWNNAQHRALLFQVLLVAALCFIAWTIAQNTMVNLEKRGISTGFSFLSQESGFGIIQSLVPYDESHTFGRTFIVGLLNTILVSACGIALATLLGFVVGIARLSKNWLISRLAGVYIETFRNIPLLLQIFFWYFAVLRALPSPKQSLSFADSLFLNIRGLYIPRPIFEDGFGAVLIALVVGIGLTIWLTLWARKRQRDTGKQFKILPASAALIILLPLAVFFLAGSPITWELPQLKGFNFRGGLSIIPEFTALLVALSIYTGAFIAEAVRSGIMAVSKGQTEAASALGLQPKLVLKLVVIPQALRVIIPQLTSQYLNLVKNSSLATAIGYPDLVSVFAGTTLNQTGQAIEVVAMTMAVYLFISLTISMLMNWYNKKTMLVER